MSKSISRFLRLAARYLENPRALSVKRSGGIPETFWKLDHPWFHRLGLRAVVDVGCNDGQFALTARRLLPTAEIYSFEPIPECLARAKSHFAGDDRFRIFNCALGDRPGETSFSVSEVTGASSLLGMSSLQARHFPDSTRQRKIPVRIETLDGVLAPLAIAGPILLKIDVQGYEQQVLNGGAATLQQTKLVVLEASFEAFYEGQALFSDLYAHLQAAGFSLLDSFNMMYAPDHGRALQGDFIFIRQSPPTS